MVDGPSVFDAIRKLSALLAEGKRSVGAAISSELPQRVLKQ